MKRGKLPQWRIDWRGYGSPEEGQLIGCVSPKGKRSFARIKTVRVVRNVRPLPDGVQCRYALAVERLPCLPSNELIAWWCHMYGKKKPSVDPSTDRWSPLR